MTEKLTTLRKILKVMNSVVVAYSGGADSTLLLAVAHQVLGEKVLAVTAASPTYPSSEVEAARAIAQQLGVRFLLIESHEMDDPCFVANDNNRCYYCKSDLFGRLRKIADREGIEWVADGSNYDDMGDYRPGRRAAAELGVRSPLCEAGMTKEDIRLMSHELDLSTWDKPSLACLSSRVPYGTSITLEVLDRIFRAEELLRGLGLRQLRVRHHDDIARIEVPQESINLLMEEGTRKRVVDGLKALGYVYVTLDLAGYRSGSMNEVLSKQIGKNQI